MASLKDYELAGIIGQGAFGKVYLGVSKKAKQKVAVKMSKSHDCLMNEGKILKQLSEAKDFKHSGVQKFIKMGSTDHKSYLITELLKKDLRTTFEEAQCFCKNDLLNIGIQIIERLQYIHSKYIIHRDIKPENFVFSSEKDQEKLFLIDFGFAKKIFTDEGYHIQYEDNKNFIGNAKYASINTHLGITQSRRDDLQSAMYVLIYLGKGSLPWQKLHGKNTEEKLENIFAKKIQVRPQCLCEGLPRCFTEVLTYIRNLEFEKEPDYEMIKRKFFQELHKSNTK